MTDISKHKLIKDAYEVCLAIEECGASVELTEAVSKASKLMHDIDAFITENEPLIMLKPKIESYIGTNKYHDIDGTLRG